MNAGLSQRSDHSSAPPGTGLVLRSRCCWLAVRNPAAAAFALRRVGHYSSLRAALSQYFSMLPCGRLRLPVPAFVAY